MVYSLGASGIMKQLKLMD